MTTSKQKTMLYMYIVSITLHVTTMNTNKQQQHTILLIDAVGTVSDAITEIDARQAVIKVISTG